MRAQRLHDPALFLDATRDLLLADEARHNLMLAIARKLRDHPEVYREHRLWVVENDDGVVLGSALQTPPHNLVRPSSCRRRARGAGRGRRRSRAARLHRCGTRDRPIRGCVGVARGRDPPASHDAADLQVDRAARAGRGPRTTARCHTCGSRAPRLLDSRLHGGGARCGNARTCESRARGRRAPRRDWRNSLYAARGSAGSPLRRGPFRQALLVHGTGAFVLWEDGDAVSLVGWGGSTPNGARVGPVYTPPEHRRRGYGSAVTAAVSAERLASGRQFCFLYTDLANPTSNRIYTDIGYEAVCDSVDYASERA